MCILATVLISPSALPCTWAWPDEESYKEALSELERKTKQRALELYKNADLVFVGFLESISYEHDPDGESYTVKAVFKDTRDLKGTARETQELSWRVDLNEAVDCTESFLLVDVQEQNTYLVYSKEGEVQRTNLYLEYPHRIITGNTELEWLENQ